MIRILALLCGLSGAAVLSQYPAFTQQYVQRLAGQVDALTEVVTDFDRSALEAGLGREEALTQMTGTDFLTARQQDMRQTFARHARLSLDLMDLRAADPVRRIALVARLTDQPTFAATWADFEPAVPLTGAAVLTGAIGFVGGWGAAWLALMGLSLPFARRPKSAVEAQPQPTPARVEPRLAAPQPASFRPTLLGERR